LFWRVSTNISRRRRYFEKCTLIFSGLIPRQNFILPFVGFFHSFESKNTFGKTNLTGFHSPGNFRRLVNARLDTNCTKSS
jgi:hypothetical protein